MRALVQTSKLSSEGLARSARAILEALVPVARIQCAHLPPLFTSGVVYGVEEGEQFLDPETVYRRGAADCANLTLWHVSECRNRGIAATFQIYRVLTRPDGSRLWHVRTALPSGAIIDASEILGMGRVLAGLPARKD